MSINFEAANMAGYNNPAVKMIPAVLNSEASGFINPPSYADINNICKSGGFPVLCVAAADSFTYLLPLSEFNFYNNVGTFSFCAVVQNGKIADGMMPLVISVYFEDGAAPVVQTYEMQNPTT